MKKYLSLLPLLLPSLAHAVAASNTGTALDSIIPNLTAFIINSLIPFMALCGVVWAMYCLFFGHRSGWAIRFVLVMCIAALGLTGVSRLFGGGLVSAALWA